MNCVDVLMWFGILENLVDVLCSYDEVLVVM